MKILVCGDRNWTDREMVRNRLAMFSEGTTIIAGGCRGADTIAEEVAAELGFIIRVFPANWGKYGKGAGPRRNSEMLAEKPDLVIAFHEDLKKSKGTIDTLRKAKGMAIRTEVIPKQVWA